MIFNLLKKIIKFQVNQSKTEKLTYHMTEAVKHLHALKWKRAIDHLDEVIKI